MLLLFSHLLSTIDYPVSWKTTILGFSLAISFTIMLCFLPGFVLTRITRNSYLAIANKTYSYSMAGDDDL